MTYWVFLKGEVQGGFEPAELLALPDFSQASLVCPVDAPAAERTWKKAGEFQELVEAFNAPGGAAPPAAVVAANDVIGEASSKLFQHVSELMKELENRREERALTQSLQRTVAQLKSELLAAREKLDTLERRAAQFDNFEVREHRLQEAMQQAQLDIKERNKEIESLKRQLDLEKEDAQKAARKAHDLESDKKRLTLTLDAISKELADKEFNLAKALALIKRLQEELGRIVPEATAGISREVPQDVRKKSPPPPPVPAKLLEPEERPKPVLEVEIVESEARVIERVKSESTSDSSVFTQDDGSPEHPVPIPPEGELAPITPPWQLALKKLFFLKKK